LKQQNDAHEQHLVAGLIEQSSADESERESSNMGRRKFGPSNRSSGHTVKVEKLPRSELEEGCEPMRKTEVALGSLPETSSR
jgi:hypothetical protein